MNKIIFIVACFFLIAFAGCEKQVLNKSSKSSFTEDDVWNDINLVEKLVFAQYKGLGGFGTYNAISGDLLFTAASDETLFLFDYGMWVVNSGTIDASNMGAFAKDWRNKYSTIRNINMFLDRIDNVPNADPAKIARLKGEMKFMRAKAYADLINFFGGVPLITKVYGLNDDFTETRASYTECVNFIVKELDEAAALVPLTVSSADWGKITKGACLALKSEILLYAASKLHDPSSTPNGPLFEYNANNKWQQASDAAKAVIDMDQYSLIPADSWVDYTKIFLDVNSEIILARPYSSQYNHANIDKFNTPNGYHGYSGHVPTQRLVDDFEMDNGKMIDEQGSGYDANNPYKNRDPRFYADIVYQGANYRGRETDFSLPGGLDSRDGSESWNYSLTSYTMRKFMDESLDFNSGIGSQPYIFFRLAEIYLNYAEAQYNLGNEVVAREYVNKIRNRVKMPDISTSGQQLLKDIIRERRIELCFEDRRYYDVRRWMIADQTDNENATGVAWNKINGVLKSNPVTAQVRMFVPRMYYMPIPLSEIQKTGMEQNPGY